MDSEIMVEALPMLGMCNLCLNEGAVKSMLVPYKHNGDQEIYSEMLMKCFSIDISSVQLGDCKRVACGTCVQRLRECALFRAQVDAALDTLTHSVPHIKDDLSVKQELEGDTMAMDFAALDDDEDDMFLKDIAIKKEEKSVEKSEQQHKRKVKIKLKNKHKIKLKNSNEKVAKFSRKTNLVEIDAMLERGLFPFKIRKGQFTCSICSENSNNLDDIKTHITEHSKNNINVAFDKMMFSKSQRFYKSNTNLRCKICTTDLNNYEEVKHHLDNCTRISSISYSKYSHLPFKLEKDQLDCPVCKKTFLNFVSLNTHMNLHYPNYICESCGKAFASKARLRGHMRTHEVGSFPCKYCNATFDRVTKRENHVSKEHKSGIRYACKRCNISLTSFYARQKHLAEVHDEELKRYKCKACPQSYITPGHLSSHVRRDHLNERNHKCSQCDLAFYTKNALKMHMIKHDGERIHVCSICQKSYQRKKTLREHMRIHENDKRFVCPVCGRAFTQKCTLKGHLKVHERKIDIDEQIMRPLHSN